MANEKRLIDANALKWKLERVALYVQGLRFGKTLIGKILESYRQAVFEEIDNAPTVDAVEVVRCKDCKHFDKLFKGEGVINKIGICYLRKEEQIETAQSCDDYCSYGERKDNERKAD